MLADVAGPFGVDAAQGLLGVARRGGVRVGVLLGAPRHGGEEADVQDVRHVGEDRLPAAADDDRAADPREGADSLGGLHGDVGAGGRAGETGGEMLEPTAIAFIESRDEVVGEVVVGGDAFDELAIVFDPGRVGGIALVEDGDEARGDV